MKRICILTICFLMTLGCTRSNNVAKKDAVDINAVKIISPSEIPETKTIASIEGKGLNEYATSEKEAKVFFETNSKIRSAILVYNGILYFGNENCEFYAVDTASKQLLWTYSADEAVQTWPLITDGKIIFNAGNSLYILDSVNGNELHKVTYPAKRSFRVSMNDFAFNDSYIAVSDGIAYYAALDGTLIAVDINEGSIVWTLSSDYAGEVASGINFLNDKLYYVDYSGALCCVDIQERKMIFKTLIGDRIFAPLYINDGKIYAAGRRCRVYCIDENNGDVIWSSFSSDTSTWFSGGSVSINNTLYTGTSDEHTLVALNKDNGEFLRIYPTKQNIYTRPILNGENIVVAATDVYSRNRSYIMEFDTKNHVKLWEAQLNDCVLSPSVIYQGVLYFGSDSGKIYCIDLK